MFVVDTTSPLRKRLRTGWKERLLCSDCEQHIALFDNYAAKFFASTASWEAVEAEDITFYKVHEYDYQLLKLFILSVVWRAAVSNIEAFTQVSLAPQHQERLCQMLVCKDPGGKYDYNTAIFRYSTYKNGLEQIAFSPRMFKTKDCVRYVEIEINEFPCQVKISNQKDSELYEHFWLSDQPPLRIMEMCSVKRMAQAAKIVQEQQKRLELFRRSHEIPARS